MKIKMHQLRRDANYRFRDMLILGICAIYPKPRGTEREHWVKQICMGGGDLFIFSAGFPAGDKPVGWMFVQPYDYESGEMAIHLTHWWVKDGYGRQVMADCWDEFIETYAKPMGATLLTGKTPHNPKVYKRMMWRAGFEQAYTEFHAEI
jgi:hypothetical protein